MMNNFFATAFLLLFCCITPTAAAETAPLFDTAEMRQVPVAYKGRFRPLETAAQLWLYDLYHSQSIKSSQRQAFDSANGSALDLLVKLHFLGYERWDHAPLFWIHYAKLKDVLGLKKTDNTFSYQTLHHAIYDNSDTSRRFLEGLATYHFFKNYRDPANRAGSEKSELTQLQPGLWAAFRGDALVLAAVPQSPPWNSLTPGTVLLQRARGDGAAVEVLQDKAIAEEGMALLATLEQFKNISHTTLKLLPGKYIKGEWLSLAELKTRSDNFTLYPDALFRKIHSAYMELQTALSNLYQHPHDQAAQQRVQHLVQQLAGGLSEGYALLAGTTYKQAAGKALNYPSTAQLKAEQFYYRMPLIEACIALYAIAAALFLLAYTTKKLRVGTAAVMVLAFCLHTLVLGLRCYILERPPVSNMFETVIYVPWIAILCSFLLWYTLRNTLVLATACLASLALLVVLKLTNINSSMENVQAVLDSQYWLLIHVLMVVGSYGAFILAGVLGHVYLIGYAIKKQETPELAFIARFTVQAIYMGVAMLIPGTILGGVWAAESWGRFWDWDPKESWAFISSCVYLVGIHAYTFRHIGNFGLAIGAIIGLQAISFTWYGVNYILGTGLHSYGFGSGGEIYYYSFLLAEGLFIGYMFSMFKKNLLKNK